jgi:hypothetical protein
VLSLAVGLATPRIPRRRRRSVPFRATSVKREASELRWLQRSTKALALDVRIVMMEALSCDAPKAAAG